MIDKSSGLTKKQKNYLLGEEGVSHYSSIILWSDLFVLTWQEAIPCKSRSISKRLRCGYVQFSRFIQERMLCLSSIFSFTEVCGSCLLRQASWKIFDQYNWKVHRKLSWHFKIWQPCQENNCGIFLTDLKQIFSDFKRWNPFCQWQIWEFLEALFMTSYSEHRSVVATSLDAWCYFWGNVPL